MRKENHKLEIDRRQGTVLDEARRKYFQVENSGKNRGGGIERIIKLQNQ
jgi:hypothetical protein